MSVEVWIRARSGPALGIGHRVRALILAQALIEKGMSAGLILDEDAPDGPDGVPVHRLPDGVVPPREAVHYPGGKTPVILDLSHPTMLADLPELVRCLKAQGRRICLIDGLGREAYAPSDPAVAVDVVLTPYVLEPDAPRRAAKEWLSGAEFAVVDPVYQAVPERPVTERRRQLLVFISGTDPWQLTEAVLAALVDGGLPDGWCADVVAGPGFDIARCTALQALIGEEARLRLLHAPPNLRDALTSARLAVLGPGLAKYEAAASGTYSLIVSPMADYADMNYPFADEGLATVLPAGAPDAASLHAAIVAAGNHPHADPRALIDGAGAQRAAARIVSELFTESGEG